MGSRRLCIARTRCMGVRTMAPAATSFWGRCTQRFRRTAAVRGWELRATSLASVGYRAVRVAQAFSASISTHSLPVSRTRPSMSPPFRGSRRYTNSWEIARSNNWMTCRERLLVTRIMYCSLLVVATRLVLQQGVRRREFALLASRKSFSSSLATFDSGRPWTT